MTWFYAWLFIYFYFTCIDTTTLPRHIKLQPHTYYRTPVSIVKCLSLSGAACSFFCRCFLLSNKISTCFLQLTVAATVATTVAATVAAAVAGTGVVTRRGDFTAVATMSKPTIFSCTIFSKPARFVDTIFRSVHIFTGFFDSFLFLFRTPLIPPSPLHNTGRCFSTTAVTTVHGSRSFTVVRKYCHRCWNGNVLFNTQFTSAFKFSSFDFFNF